MLKQKEKTMKKLTKTAVVLFGATTLGFAGFGAYTFADNFWQGHDNMVQINNDLDRLSQIIKDKNDQPTKAKSDLADAQNQLKDVKSSQNDLQAKLTDAQNQLKSVQNELKQAQEQQKSDQDSFNQQLQAKEQEIQEKIQETQQAITDGNVKVQAKQQEIDKANQQVSNLNNKVNDLTNQLNQKSQDTQSLSQAIKEANKRTLLFSLLTDLLLSSIDSLSHFTVQPHRRLCWYHRRAVTPHNMGMSCRALMS